MASTQLDETQAKGFCRVWVDYSVDVAAPAATLYTFLRDIDAWPSWTPGLKAIKRERDSLVLAPMPPGTPFTLVLDGGRYWFDMSLPCKLFVAEPTRIEWGGGIPGSRIRHRFELTSVNAQTTRVRHVEYSTNLLALVSLPVEWLIRAHDRRWSNAIRAHFTVKADTLRDTATAP
jgi:Polyketide cyclase / dehydrase and lipid transport